MSAGPLLLVEDDADDAYFFEQAYRAVQPGGVLRSVTDGDQAVAYLSGAAPFSDRAENPLPAHILLDLKLPRRSGFEVLAWVRAQETIRRIPVIILSSSTEKRDIDRAYDLGANSFLKKPIDTQALELIVRHLDEYWYKFNLGPEL